ncbi:hypothetical protein [Corynebacterium sp. UBA2622]|uniref:hypothetical protein n=1 Tax=Corynebacterium sp. UBA2622 TaxID=1946393 RepID=UPI0025BBC012|nr:hypothetical protein [Corynebacterium sp. UBA2622]
MPGSASHVSAGAVAGGSPNAPGGKGPVKLPEAVRYLLLCLTTMLGAELAHLFVSTASMIMDPSALRESARDAAKSSGEEVSDAMINASVYGSVIMMVAFQLLIVGLLVFAVRALARRASWASNALRLLQFFSVFFVLRMLALFLMTPDSASVPVAMYAVDGILQIAAGAAGACALFYSMQNEVQNFVRTPTHGADTTTPKDG